MRIALLSMLLVFELFAQKIVFTPLPIWSAEQSLKEYTPLTLHIEKKLGVKVQFKHIKDYAQIINSFKDQKIDLAVMGPLPFIFLQKEYQHLYPVAVFKNKNNKARYRCALIKFKDDEMKTSALKVALTQPLSTCGYHNTKKLLQKNYGIDLDEVEYSYLGSHSKAAKAVLSKEYTVAGVKEDIARRFSSVGIESIDLSKEVPEFVLVANTKTLPKNLVKGLEKLLLGLSEKTVQNFGLSSRNGFDKVDLELYKQLQNYEIKY